MFKSYLIILLNSAVAFSIGDFQPTKLDLEVVRTEVNRISHNTKLVIISDAQHRLPNTRAATILIAQAIAEKFPKEKVCLFLETTEKVNPAWDAFKKGDGTESSYNKLFEPIAGQLANSVEGLTTEKAARVYIEPSFFVANYLRAKVPNIDIFGVDVDYTDRLTFSTLYNNAKPPRKLNDTEFAKIFIADRNKLMAKRATDNISGGCSRAILSAGNMHVQKWKADKKIFPNYTGKPIPGIIDLIDKKITKEPVIIELYVNRDRVCPEGQARIQIENCSIKFSRENRAPNRVEIELPVDFYSGRLNSDNELKEKDNNVKPAVAK